MITKANRNTARQRRHLRVRKRVNGSTERPRLNVFRSNQHIYAQVVDDITGQTLVSASTLEKAFRVEIPNGGNMEAARQVGSLVAKRALEKGLTQVVFDRGGYLYHGRVQALAEAAREAGLEF
ncbi:50S ribosomal protein L18 [Alicyclobacillaceae bacterium I2511]|jgi:large subunit ribosomal protein L18|nr:50S ribosomal protein L18 [Alicyclobacillaceae bacterium I2511]